MGTARAIASLTATALVSGPRLLFNIWWALRKARGQVKKGARTMYKTLVKEGIPDENARQIAVSFAKPAYNLLQIRSIIKMVQNLDMD
jgi:hypothetical protein